ncbi:udp-glucuronosyl udp-glucosyltransferase [Pochonia chlamydosporia 170]|nr:udp-glucuronosyl udp-glucosyltransferase [Pochonia chlamydosporia 170]OWT42231.1 udp-glucuronosyl udp-glucosyltransferase [Pochonia chlamydosporia 170]
MRNKIERIGAEWLEITTTFGVETDIALQKIISMPLGMARLSLELTWVFFNDLPRRIEQVGEALGLLQGRNPSRQIILIEDVFNLSAMVYKYGRPLPGGLLKMPHSIGVGASLMLVESEDTAPIFLGLPPDSTTSGKLRNKALNALYKEGPMKPVTTALNQALSQAGCTHFPEEDFFTATYTAHDITIQLCSESMEYLRSDLPSSIHFIGVLPRIDTGLFEQPGWWSEIERARATRNSRVIVVSQANVNHSDLITPTVLAFSDQDDVNVIVILGENNKMMTHNVQLPPHVRIANSPVEDQILKFADVFVSNSGYGAFTCAVRNGV